MKTAQIDTKTNTVFAIIEPRVEGDPPRGIVFYHFDPTKEDVKLGDHWDPKRRKPVRSP